MQNALISINILLHTGMVYIFFQSKLLMGIEALTIEFHIASYQVEKNTLKLTAAQELSTPLVFWIEKTLTIAMELIFWKFW